MYKHLTLLLSFAVIAVIACDCEEFTISYNSIDNPDVISGISYLYYHYNWGWGNEDSAWYAYDDDNYQYSRQNYLISKPH